MTNGIRTLLTLSLLSLVPGPGAAQVPAATEAYVWRGLDAEWGEWTHRLGKMGSYVTSVDDSGYAIDVRGQLEGGVFRDPGGASLTTHFTHYSPGDGEAGVRFWHLEGDAIELSGAYRCDQGHDGTEAGVFRGTVTLGNAPGGGFDPGRIDPHGPTPDQFPHQLALLNGISIDPRVPNDAHTVDLVHVALDGEPVYHPATGTLDVLLHLEYRPGCVPPVGHVCSNAVEAPRGARRWTVEIRPYLLLAAWHDGPVTTTGVDGAMVDDSELDRCGGVDRVVELERIIPLFETETEGESQPLLGFRGWTVAAGAPDETYADGARAASCERCAVALRGRHIRQFGFSLDRAGDGAMAVVRGRWQSHPFDGNPYTRGKVNPHWPVWSWDLAGLYVDGELRDDELIATDRPALSVDQGVRLTATLAETAPTLHALIPTGDVPLTP